MIVYESFGSLIKDYRHWRGLSQEMLAASIKISVRALQRWEANRCNAARENLHDFSEVTGIPMQVCVALNAGQPVRYMMHNRRFAFSPLELEKISAQQLLTPHEMPEDGIFLKNDPITTEKQIGMVHSCHRDIYGAQRTLPKDVIKAACQLLPDLNRIAFDRWGHYVGHFFCLPISMNLYNKFKEQNIAKYVPKIEDICDIFALRTGVFLYYSLFAPSASVAYMNMITGIRYLSKIKPRKGYMVVFHSAARGAEDIFINLGMRKVFEETGNHENMDKEILTTMYEIELETLLNPQGPFGALGCLAEEFNKKSKKRRLIGRAEIAALNANPPLEGKSADFQQQIASSVTSPEDEKLLVGGTKDTACPNPACQFYNIKQARNIICNGQYITKRGILSQRFMCKKCGKSFCSNAGSLFYDLHHSPEKVMMAFKLLVKGMPLRGVAEVLGVKLDTVRRWLHTAANHSDKIEALLREQIKVSPARLNALWNYAKSNNLRQRATLWNQKKDVKLPQ